LQEAVKLEKELNSDDLGVALGNLATALQDLGEYREVLDLQQQSIALCRQKPLHNQLPTALTNYAVTLSELGYLRQSLEPLQEALGLQQKMQGIELGTSLTLITLGQSHRDLCQFEQALEFLKQALELSEENNVPTVVFFAATLAHVYSRLGQAEAARKLLEKAMNHLPEYPLVRAGMFREQGRWYLGQGQHEKAQQSFEEAKKQLEQGQRKLTLGAIYLLEAVILPPKESLQISKQVLEDAREGELKGGLAIGALTRCAQASLKLGQAMLALEYSQEAISMLATYDPDTFYLGEIHLTHYQALSACKDTTAKDYLGQTLTWLIDIADKHVPSEYRESFLTKNNVNKEILEAARLEGLLKADVSSL
jgi:tetratricopeptide (TPR) repeat protein